MAQLHNCKRYSSKPYNSTLHHKIIYFWSLFQSSAFNHRDFVKSSNFFSTILLHYLLDFILHMIIILTYSSRRSSISTTFSNKAIKYLKLSALQKLRLRHNFSFVIPCIWGIGVIFRYLPVRTIVTSSKLTLCIVVHDYTTWTVEVNKMYDKELNSSKNNEG